MRNYSDKTLEAYRYWIAKFKSCAEQAPGSSQYGRCLRISDGSCRAPEHRRRNSESGIKGLDAESLDLSQEPKCANHASLVGYTKSILVCA
jgi:hypothetical protein